MGKYLISVDELRANGALDVPEWRRKSLGSSEKNLFSEVADEENRISEPAKKRANKPKSTHLKSD